jgi:putative transposase
LYGCWPPAGGPAAADAARPRLAWPRLAWPDRALFAALLTLIPRSRHDALHSFITPGTILRWHCDIVRRRWAATSRANRPGRPPAHRHIVRLVLRVAADNEHGGYRRIAGELAGLGIAVAPSTVWEILKRHGIDPAPRRAGPDWAQFPRSQAGAIVALDLFTVDLLDRTKAYVLAAIEHATRRIRILGAGRAALRGLPETRGHPMGSSEFHHYTW